MDATRCSKLRRRVGLGPGFHDGCDRAVDVPALKRCLLGCPGGLQLLRGVHGQHGRNLDRARRAAGCEALTISLLPDYSRQAEHYDETRSASRSVLRPLREALTGAPGARLADIGGGTGNYALALKREGWQPVVIDRSAEMLARASAKGLHTVHADAQRLPFADETFDAAMMISMLHHVEDRGAALVEARRILRPGGRLVLMGFTGEDAAALWILDYFPSSWPWMEAAHPPRSAFLEELPGALLVGFQFEDMNDQSLAALSADPERVVAAAQRGQTSFFERMQRHHPEELQAGLARLRADVAAGRAQGRAGTASVLSWTKPLSRQPA